MKSFANMTLYVATLFSCDNMTKTDHSQNILYKQTVLGCYIIRVMQEFYGFEIDYVYQNPDIDRGLTAEIAAYYVNSSRVDFFARPMSLRTDVLQLATPIGAVFDWDFGFTIALPDVSYLNFYSKPFTHSLWNLLYAMALFCSLLFYFLKRWECKINNGEKTECSYGYELLMVVGAYCQHIPPIEARILSRRTAYMVFFIFAYIIYTYYTSNLLSHLVNDSHQMMTLQELLESDMQCVVLDTVKPILNNIISNLCKGSNMCATYQKLMSLKSVSLEEGLKAVKTTKTALLSDYVSVSPFLPKIFTSNDICSLAKIDVIVNLKKYFFVSNSFPQHYMELAKISLLRLKETGVMSHVVAEYYNDGSMECTPPYHVQTQFLQIVWPLTVLVATYVLSLVILVVEIWWYNKNKVLPYVN